MYRFFVQNAVDLYNYEEVIKPLITSLNSDIMLFKLHIIRLLIVIYT